MDTGCLTVFYTGRLHTFFCPMGTKVAQIRRKRKVVKGHPLQGLQDMLIDDDTEFSGWIPMFLLAGDLAGTAASAVIILYKKSVF